MQTLKDIINRYPLEFQEGLKAIKDSVNPYPQSFHFDLTVNDAKHIAWREGNKESLI